MDKIQAEMFFEAASTLMSIQLRQLITDSIKQYMYFFQKFDKKYLPEPEEMIANIPKKWPNAFLKLRMVAQDGKVVFSENYEEIIHDLENVILKVAERSEKILRPDQAMIESVKSPYL